MRATLKSRLLTGQRVNKSREYRIHDFEVQASNFGEMLVYDYRYITHREIVRGCIVRLCSSQGYKLGG